MVMITITNAARASNLINITLSDIKEAKPSTDILGFTFESKKYKTSVIYGMWLSKDIFEFMDGYIDYVRPLISSEESKYLFTSSKQRVSRPIDHSMIPSAMTTSFTKAGLFKKEEKQRVSPSRLRCTCVTELVGVTWENSDDVTLHFMKHRPSTSRKFYMAYWENREALRLSMKCHSSFVNLTKDHKKRIDRRDALLQKLSLIHI